MFNLRFTFILLIILLVPYYLRYKNNEPYPSVLLPSGGYNLTKRNNNTAILERSHLYGLNHAGKWQRMDVAKILKPIPYHYSKIMFDENRGILDRSGPHNSDVLELGSWLKLKLRRQQLSYAKLKMVYYKNTVDLTNGRLTDSIITHEKLFAVRD
jgi:hypothetical protein